MRERKMKIKTLKRHLTLGLGMVCLTAALTGCQSKNDDSGYDTGDPDSDIYAEDTDEETGDETTDDYDTGFDDDTTLDTEDPETDDTGLTDDTGDEDPDSLGGDSSGDQSDRFTTVDEAELARVFGDKENDYKKVRWGVQYKPNELEGLLISVTPYQEDSSNYLLLALTNLYDKDLTVSGEGYAVGTNNENIGDFTITNYAIRPGGTVLTEIYCEGESNGVLHWSELSASPDEYYESVNWESDWALGKGETGEEALKYTLTCNDTAQIGDVHALVLNKDGFVIGYGNDYNPDETSNAEGVISFFGEDNAKLMQTDAVDVAVFANPVKSKE